jgi:DNA-binding MarR family transcriptional regulator
MTGAEYSILLLLSRPEGVAELFEVSRMKTVVRVMIKKGWVEAIHVPDRKPAVFLSITGLGRSQRNMRDDIAAGEELSTLATSLLLYTLQRKQYEDRQRAKGVKP